jgi:hypothetical protein
MSYNPLPAKKNEDPISKFDAKKPKPDSSKPSQTETKPNASSAKNKEKVRKLLQAYFELTKKSSDSHPEALDDYLYRIYTENQITGEDFLQFFLKEIVLNGYRDVIEKRASSIESFFFKKSLY